MDNDKFPLYHRHPITPFMHEKLTGKVKATFLRGEIVFLDGKHANTICGRSLLKHSDF